jgi:creatinine amidohydrolase/Fe(II)-dependent formamide hydrolase-like protein
MDSLAAINVARAVAERTNSVAVQTTLPGYSPHHMGFCGTITFHEDTLIAVLMDTIESLAYHGVEKQLIVNAHGGNREIVAYVCRVASREFDIQVVSPGPRVGRDVEAGLEDFVKRMDVHSGPGETGLALHLFPELVDMSRVKGYEPLTEYPEELQELLDPDRDDLDLALQVFATYIRDSHDFTETGVWGFADPNDADVEVAADRFEQRVEWLARFIKLWKTLPTIEEVYGY